MVIHSDLLTSIQKSFRDLLSESIITAIGSGKTANTTLRIVRKGPENRRASLCLYIRNFWILCTVLTFQSSDLEQQETFRGKNSKDSQVYRVISVKQQWIPEKRDLWKNGPNP